MLGVFLYKGLHFKNSNLAGRILPNIAARSIKKKISLLSMSYLQVLSSEGEG
jgi:hypothetical protein